MQRWAASQGVGLPVDPRLADALPRTRLPPLPDDVAIITDQIVLHSPTYFQRFTFKWYRSPKPRELIAEELGLPVIAIPLEHHVVLAYFMGRLVGAGIVLPKLQKDW